jgi:hypothetical protein
MNDNELITALREQRNKVPMTTPVEQIINRGHAVRARRRIPGLAGVLAVVAAAAFAVIALLPASHPASHQPGVQLAAWTVVKQAGGTVSVTIRELRDPAGLQSTLRADGVPASVAFPGQKNFSCQHYSAGIALINTVFTVQYAGGFPVMIIHPSALPSGAGVEINPPAQPANRVAIGLVYTSPQCTGS